MDSETTSHVESQNSIMEVKLGVSGYEGGLGLLGILYLDSIRHPYVLQYVQIMDE
jgi:hypothetical protein